MRSKMLPVLVLLCFLFGMLFKPAGAMGQIAASNLEATVYGKVVDFQTNISISNATAMLWDVTPMKMINISKTDIKGEYRFSIAPPDLNPLHSYVIYVFHNSSADTFDYMPTKTRAFNFSQEKTRAFNFSLIPAATIYLEGDIYYVEGVDPSPSFIVALTDPRTQKPLKVNSMNGTVIIQYGDTTDNWFLKFGPRLVIVPAGIPMDLDVDARVWTAKLRRYTRISFLVDNEGKHFVLPSSQTYTRVRLDKYALKVSFDFVDERVSDILETLENATRIGFYVTPLRERMLEGKSLAESAEDDVRKGEYSSAFGKLRMAISYGEEVIRNLEYMKLTAILGSLLLLPFFAGYAVAGAFFLSEKEKQKLLFGFVLYALEIVGFYYFYPGCKLMDFNYFVLSVVAIFAVVLFLVFGFPRIVKEAGVPGRVRLRTVIAQIFSIGKRNLKRKKLRTTLITISISVLVLSFTAFTSVGRVYGIVREPVPGVAPLYDGGLIMDPINQTTWNFLPLSFQGVNSLQSELGVGLIAPKAINAPQEGPIGSISATNGRKQEVYGIVGVNASVEKQFTGLHELEQLEQENDSIIISSEAAERLNVDVGDKLTFYHFVGGYEVPYKNYTLVGIMDDSRLSDVQEINKDPFLPRRKIVEDETVKVVPVNSSDVIFLPLMAALDIPSVSISRIAFNFGDKVQMDDLARKIIYVLEYSVWISSKGEITWWHLGYYLEVRGGEILILFFIVMLQIATMMVTIVKEREQEVKVMSTLGLNPTHIAGVFLAESIVAGIIGGGLGYILGSSFYQLLSLFSINLVVRQKLEWYWSAAGLAVAVLASILSSVRSAMSAAMSTVPSIVRRVRYDTEREKWEREKEIFKAFVPEEVSLPIRIKENDIAIFNLFILDGLGELKTGAYERVGSLEDVSEEETLQGDIVKRIRFAYYFSGYSAQAELIMRKPRQKGFYSIYLRLAPQPGVPEAFLSHIKLFVNDLCIKWEKRIM